MKILLVNDDGFQSDGIKILEDVLSQRGHEVWVCAPESQRSACSHAITLHQGTVIKKVYDRHYVCEGYPADCVLYALLGAVPIGKPDLIVSGINEGFNVSSDLLYSATFAAAEEGALKGIPSIALSCETVMPQACENGLPQVRNFEVFPFSDAAVFLADNLDLFLKTFEPGSFLNINVPDHANGKWNTAYLGLIEFHDVLERNGTESYFKIHGASFPDIVSDEVEKTDYYTVFVKKQISVTAVKSENRYCDTMMKKLSSLT